jgi:hypothetical protein
MQGTQLEDREISNKKRNADDRRAVVGFEDTGMEWAKEK